MDRETLKGTLHALYAERQEVTDRIARDQTNARNLDRAIEGIEGLLGLHESSLAPSANGAGPTARPRRASTPQGPRGIEAVRQILIEGPWLTPAELARALQERGWGPESNDPESAVRAAANRLRRRDPRFDLRNGRYGYRPQRNQPELASDSAPEAENPQEAPS